MSVLRQIVVVVAAGILCLTLNSTVSKVYAAAPGEVENWTASSNLLPQGRIYAGSVIHNGYIYMIGGSGIDDENAVFYAQLNADGSTGPWTTSSNSLPTPLVNAGVVVNDGYIYVIGGYSNDIGYSNTVFYAHINADGSVGAWVTSPHTLPQAMLGMTAVTYNGYLYISGGQTFSAILDTVSYARLNADGSTGPWTTSSNSLPFARFVSTSVIYNGFWYVMGGIPDGGVLSLDDVTYAPLNPDGSVGAWETTSSDLPEALYYASSVAYDGYLFVFGGLENPFAVASNMVYSAPLSADGSIGSWKVLSNPMPQTLMGSAASAYNGRVYILGGSDNSSLYSDVVYYAHLAGYPKPVINTHSSSVVSGSSITVDVLADATSDPDPSTLKIISSPAHGTAGIVSAKIVYSPTAGYAGSDSLIYEVCSLFDASVCSQATITFDVLGVSAVAATAPNTGLGSSMSPVIAALLCVAGFFTAIVTGSAKLCRQNRRATETAES